MEPMTILLVDDETRFLATTQKVLARKGVSALVAESGEQALAILESTPVHVVILDVKMPGMDGLATLSAMKSRHPQIDVIMLTGHATLESAVEGMKSGAGDYLMKPCDIDLLVAKARDAYEKRLSIEERLQASRQDPPD